MNNNFVFLQLSFIRLVARALFIGMMCASHLVCAYVLDLKQAILNSDIHKVQSIVFVENLSVAERGEMLQLAEQVYAHARSEAEKRFWRHRKNWYAIVGGLALLYVSVPITFVAKYHPFDFYNKAMVAHCGADHVYNVPELITAYVPDKLAFLGVAGTGAGAAYYGLGYIKAGFAKVFVKERFKNAQLIRDYFLLCQ